MSDSAIRLGNIRQTNRRPRGRRNHLTAVYIVLSAGALIMIAPYAVALVTSLKTYAETIAVPPTILPASPQWGNYFAVNGTFPILIQLGNSALVTAARVAGQLIFCSMAAYAFARLRFPFRGAVFAVFLSVLMVPGQLFLLPQYQIMQSLGWLDTLQALFLPGIFSAFGVFLLRQFFLTIPEELEEAARLDGANPWQIFSRIMLPLIRPALAALALLTMVASWSDFLWPLIVNSTPERLPVSVGLADLIGQYTTPYELIMAGSIIASLPMILVFLFAQRSFVKGLAAGALK